MTGVHPAAVVGPEVDLGVGVTVGPFAVLTGRCRIGDGVWIGPHAIVGTPAQMRDGAHPAVGIEHDGAPGIEVGDHTVVREFVTIHQGTVSITHVGRSTYLMTYANVPHDAWIGDHCTLSSSVQLGGHTWVDDGANLGLGVVAHQRSVIGAGAMVGMQAVVTRPIPPFSMAVGVPAKAVGANLVALRRLGMDDADAASWGEELRAGARSSTPPALLAPAFERFGAACARVKPKGVAVDG